MTQDGLDDALPAPYVPQVGDRCEVVHLHAWAGRIGRVREVRPDGTVTLDVTAPDDRGRPTAYRPRVPVLALRPAKARAAEPPR